MNIHNILLALLIVISVAAVFFTVKAIKKQHWGNILQASIALIIALGGWIYFSNNNQTFVGSPELEITDQIEQNQLKTPHFNYITGLHPYEWTDRVRRIWRGWFLFC
jgi:uncharacterized membrane protein